MTRKRRGTVAQYRLDILVNPRSTESAEGRCTCRSTQSNSFDNIRGPPYAAIDEQLEVLVREAQPPSCFQLSRHLNKHLNTRPSEVKLTTTMVRKHNSGQPFIVGFQGILARERIRQNFSISIASYLPPNTAHPSESAALYGYDKQLSVES